MLSIYLATKFVVFSQIGGEGEYRNLNSFFHKLGITHRIACPHTHQQNGSAERKHRHIVETGLTLLAHASVPFRYWSDAFFTAYFLINRMPTPVLDMKTTVKLFFHESPDYTFLKVFGCACWPHTRPYNNRKLEFCSKKCVFLGYSSQHKGYKCLHIPSNRVYISRDVVFDENVFHFFPSVSVTPHTPLASYPTSIDQFEDVARAPLLLPNHGTGIGRGACLELLEDSPQAGDEHVAHVDHHPMQLHGTVDVSASVHAPASPIVSFPGDQSLG
jgi:hypothetical protein